jgi:hypothetical protein
VAGSLSPCPSWRRVKHKARASLYKEGSAERSSAPSAPPALAMQAENVGNLEKKNGSGTLAEEVWNLEKFSNTLLYSIV